MLKIIVPSLIKWLYRKFPAQLQSGSVQSGCFEEVIQNGQQQAVTYEESMKFDAGVISTVLTTNSPENPHDLILAPVPPGSYHLCKDLFLFQLSIQLSSDTHWKADALQFPLLIYVPSLFFTFKSCHFSPIHEETCLKGSAQIYCLVLLAVHLKTYNSLWLESKWMNPLNEKKKKKIQGWINGNTQFPTAAWPEHPKGESFC